MNDTFDPVLFQKRLKEVSGKDSDEVIAEKAGVNRSTVQRWYRLEGPSAPKADVLIRLADAYHCTVDYLLGRDPEGRAEKNNLTVKDVCRMLMAIDEQYPFSIDTGREELETELDREYSNARYDFSEHFHTGMIIQFSPHVQPVVSVPDDYESHGYTAATMYINEFLFRYMKGRSFCVKDPEAMVNCKESLLKKIDEDRAPRFEKKNGR